MKDSQYLGISDYLCHGDIPLMLTGTITIQGEDTKSTIWHEKGLKERTSC